MDQLQRFSFEGLDIRGELAHLNEAFEAIIERHPMPELVTIALGELMAATALLSANLKFPGRLTLQMRLTGSVSLLQAETNEKGQLRAIARYEEEAELHLADGSLVITIEPDVGQKYQGITPVSAGNVSQSLEEYFYQSEQLPTKFWLACDGKKAAGLMIQKLPEDLNNDPDAWNRVLHLSSTVKNEELLELDNETLLKRLYHEETIRLYPASELSFFCTCSQERIGKALHQLGYDELQSILEEMGKISINCDFCQQGYHFQQQDIDELFPERKLQ